MHAYIHTHRHACIHTHINAYVCVVFSLKTLGNKISFSYTSMCISVHQHSTIICKHLLLFFLCLQFPFQLLSFLSLLLLSLLQGLDLSVFLNHGGTSVSDCVHVHKPCGCWLHALLAPSVSDNCLALSAACQHIEVCMYACMYAYMYSEAYVCVFMCIQLFTHTHMHMVCMHVKAHVYIYVSTLTCT